MARKQMVRIGVDVDSAAVRSTLAKFRGLPKEASQAMRVETQGLVSILANRMQAAAQSDSPQSALIAPTIKAQKDRVPVITLGGAKRVGRNRAPAHKILFGAEFGSSSLRQFRPHLGRGSYFAFKTFEENRDEFFAMWQRIGDELSAWWGEGSGGFTSMIDGT